MNVAYGPNPDVSASLDRVTTMERRDDQQNLTMGAHQLRRQQPTWHKVNSTESVLENL
jgi:hypothetical protein